MSEQLSLSEWRERQQERRTTVEDVLPSGLIIERRKHLSLEAMVFNGTLPMGVFSDLIEERGSDDGRLELDVNDVLANASEYGELVDAIFQAAMINPAIGAETDLEADPPILALSEFDELLGDKLYVMGALMGDTADLRPFRGGPDEPPEDGAPTRNGSGVLPEAIGTAGDSG